MATNWNFDPNYSLPNVTQVSLPKKFQIVAMWLQFSTEEYSHRVPTDLNLVALKCTSSDPVAFTHIDDNADTLAFLNREVKHL